MSLSVEPASSAPTNRDALSEAIASLDAGALARRFHEERVLVLDFLPRALVHAIEEEGRTLAPLARRTFIPFVRRGGAIPHPTIRERAPTLLSLQRSEALLSLFARISGAPLERRLEGDPHASALYVYSARGDHVGWHYDDCGCERLASFTVIVGVADESSSRLDVETFVKEGRPKKRSIATPPGTMVFFAGSDARHRVTPLRRGERRISFSFVYVAEGKHPKGAARVYQTAIDTLLYFGRRGFVQR